MNRITVLRHAKSLRDDHQLADFDRPLNERGWEAARRLGHELQHRAFQFDLVLASPAARVRETIDGLREEFDFAAPIRFEDSMYLAGEDQLLAIVRSLPERVQRPLLIGHNPGLQHFLLKIAQEATDRLRTRIEYKFPTAAMAVLEIGASSWKEVRPASGRIVELIVLGDL